MNTHPGSPDTLTADDVAAAMARAPSEAAAWLRGLAEQGVAEAQALLGQMLLDGQGVETDRAAALLWFLKAAATGHPMALNMAGRCYENGWGTAVNAAAAVHFYRRAADQGLDWGMYNYATQLMLGSGVATNRAAAFGWFCKAADAGHAKSINIVGGFHEDGWDTPRDLAAARRCYESAAAKGDFRGQFNFGRVLASEGRTAEAREMFSKAAQVATPAFLDKMIAFLQGSPLAAYRDLAASLETARR